MNKVPRFLKFAPLQLLLCSAVFLLATAATAPAEEAAKAVLTAADCVKCHQKEPQEIAANGRRTKPRSTAGSVIPVIGRW